MKRGSPAANRVSIRHAPAAAAEKVSSSSSEADADMTNVTTLDVEIAPASPSTLVPAARAQAELMMAMGAMQMLMLATTSEQLESAIAHAKTIRGVPPQALEVARQLLALRQQGGGGAGAAALAALQGQMQSMMVELQGKAEMLATLESKLKEMKITQEHLEQENQLLRDTQHIRASYGADDDDDDEQAKEDRMASELYAAAKKAILDAIAQNQTPSAQLYLERDVHLYRLSDADLKAE
jgi:hypothetical protein